MRENIYCGLESRHYSKNYYPYDTNAENPRYHTLNRYHTVDKCNFGTSASGETPFYSHRMSLPPDNKYARRKKQHKHKSRPKPLQYENEKYYDLVFPKREVQGSVYYQSSRLDHAEL